MKQKQLAKYIFASVLAVSLFSVLYVNAGPHHPSGTDSGQQPPVEAASIKEEEQKQERDIPVPDVTVIGRIIDIAQRLITYAP
ncbi:MAG: hypothetical protein ACKVU2_09815 [Saprospiraceae bacterium]